MSLLVVGSIAIDSVQTPAGIANEALGGSASYFSYAASFFTPVRVVGVIGEDFPQQYLAVLNSRPQIDLRGVQKVLGKTFRWKGKYTGNMNVAETLEVHLNVLGTFDPDIPGEYRDSLYVFLANDSPVNQRKVLHQVRNPKLVVADTMNFWIETQRDELLELLRQVDGVVLNDMESMLLTGESTLVNAGRAVLKLGPKFAIVKKGEHGAMLFHGEGVFAMPAFPTDKLADPTGAGDSFAGGLMGYLASQQQADIQTLKQGMAFGAVTASFNVEDFSLGRLLEINRSEIDQRYEQYRAMLAIA